MRDADVTFWNAFSGELSKLAGLPSVARGTLLAARKLQAGKTLSPALRTAVSRGVPTALTPRVQAHAIGRQAGQQVAAGKAAGGQLGGGIRENAPGDVRVPSQGESQFSRAMDLVTRGKSVKGGSTLAQRLQQYKQTRGQPGRTAPNQGFARLAEIEKKLKASAPPVQAPAVPPQPSAPASAAAAPNVPSNAAPPQGSTTPSPAPETAQTERPAGFGESFADAANQMMITRMIYGRRQKEKPSTVMV